MSEDKHEVIRVDGREGSVDLIPLLEAYGSGKGVEIVKTSLEFADFAWTGNGPHGRCSVGVERKRIRDLINSMRTGRLTGHQLPGLLKNYDYVWLAVEGVFRGNPNTGLLEEARIGKWKDLTLGRQRVMFNEVDNFMTSISVQTPVKVIVCPTQHDTTLWLLNAYKWWQKEWRGHKSCKVIYDPFPARAYLVKPTVMRKMANQIPGIGWERSDAVDVYFDSPVDMVTATAGEWEKLPGIGEATARRIVRIMMGEEKE